MPTLKEVAERAGVSTATVSKVLSNTPYFSEETRARVMEAIAALGYVPNPVARAVSKGRTYIVGLASPLIATQLADDPHLVMFMCGVDEVLREHDYNLLLLTATAQGDANSAYRRLVRTRYVDGAVIGEPPGDEALRQQLAQQDYPLVVKGYHGPFNGINTIHADDCGGARQLTDHLIALGHRRVGLISCVLPLHVVERRVAGFREALLAHDLPWHEDRGTAGDFTFESGYRAAHRLMHKCPDLTALFALNDRMAMGAIRALRERGLSVPGDVSVAGFDDVPEAARFDPPLTTVRQPSLDMGHLAAQKLLALIDGVIDSFDSVELPAELVVRASSGSAPALHGGR